MLENLDPKKGSETSSCTNRDEVVNNNLNKDLMLIKNNEEEARRASKEYFGGDELAAQVWVNKYALKDSQGNLSENTSEDMYLGLIGELKKVEFSRYLGPIDNKVPVNTPVNLVDIYKIATTDKGLKKMIHQLRMLTGREFTDFKIRLPYITPGGIFRERGISDLIKESNIFCFDFDKLDISPQELLNSLLSDRYFETQLAFVSPSGRGLKWFIYCPFMKNKVYADAAYGGDCMVAEVYRWTYESISNYVADVYGYKPDGQCKNISRACFLSYDEGAYINPLLIGDEPNEYNLIRRKEFDFVRWSSSEKKIVMDVECNKEVKYVSNSTIDGGYIWADSDSDEAHIEAAVRYLEEHCVDITSDYNVWCNIGFAFVNSLGVGGRKYYHRVSSFYSGYTYSETEKKYDNLLVTTRNNIGIATFFKYFTDATGMKVATKREEKYVVDFNSSCEMKEVKIDENSFAMMVYEDLVPSLQQMVEGGKTHRDKDIRLLGTIQILGLVMNRVCFYHHRRKPYYCNFYLGVIGNSGTGKSVIDDCRYLLKDIESDKKNEWKRLCKEYDERKKQNGGRYFLEKQPVKRSLVLGGNLTDASLRKFLEANDEIGLIYAQEAESLIGTFKQKDWGGVATSLNHAFEHESIESSRSGENEWIEIECPKLSVLMSGTPNQLDGFMAEYESGLGSRFLFYKFEGDTEFDISVKDEAFEIDELKYKVKGLYDVLSKREEDLIVEVNTELFNQRFNSILRGKGGDFYKSFILRCGLNVHRFMAILAVWRAFEEGEDLLNKKTLIISDIDFEIAWTIIDSMVEHTIEVIDEACKRQEELNKQSRFSKGVQVNRGKIRLDEFFEALPVGTIFKTVDAYNIGNELNIPRDSVNKYLKKGIGSVLQDMGHGKYIKPMV